MLSLSSFLCLRNIETTPKPFPPFPLPGTELPAGVFFAAALIAKPPPERLVSPGVSWGTLNALETLGFVDDEGVAGAARAGLVGVLFALVPRADATVAKPKILGGGIPPVRLSPVGPLIGACLPAMSLPGGIFFFFFFFFLFRLMVREPKNERGSLQAKAENVRRTIKPLKLELG